MNEQNNRRKFYIPDVQVGHFGRPKASIRKTKRISSEERKKKSTFHRVIDFCCQNANSVHSEERENLTKLGILDSKSDVIVLTETRIGKGSNTFHIPGYKIVAQEDRKRGAGGIMILAKENLTVSKAEAESPVSLVLLPCQLMKRQLICQKLVRKLLLLVCCFSQ